MIVTSDEPWVGRQCAGTTTPARDKSIQRELQGRPRGQDARATNNLSSKGVSYVKSNLRLEAGATMLDEPRSALRGKTEHPQR
jgi:hypothetical protein